MKKSAEVAQKNLDEYYDGRKGKEAKETKEKWGDGPQPGGPSSPPVSPESDEELKKEKEEAVKKNDVPGLIKNLYKRAKREKKESVK